MPQKLFDKYIDFGTGPNEVSAIDIPNDSSVTGANVKEALDNIKALNDDRTKYYGEIFHYVATGGADIPMNIDTASLYHGVVMAAQAGTCLGFTAKAGASANISSVANNGNGTLLITTSTNHGMDANDYITHTGFNTRTGYRGKFKILTVPALNQYTVTGTYTASDTGFAKRGISLKAGTGVGGVYEAVHTIALLASANNKRIKIELANNLSDLDNIACEQTIGTSMDTVTACGLLTVADGDTIWMTVANLTDAADVSFRHVNLNLVKITK